MVPHAEVCIGAATNPPKLQATEAAVLAVPVTHQESNISPETVPQSKPGGVAVKRRALKLGLVASLFGLIGRATARAEDALTIDKDGATIAAKYISFGTRLGSLVVLYNPGYELGIQPSTLYARSNKNFAWYKGGKFDQRELDPGGGSKMMSLTDGTLTVGEKFVGKGAVPPGAILMWSGDPSKLPAGWALCNGANGTPDLQDRFVVGYNPKNPSYSVIGKTGGEATHTLTIAEMPAHNHGAAGQHGHTISVTGHGWAYTNYAQSGDPNQGDGRGNCRTSEAPAHTHATEGRSQAHENRPPFYTLAYIMFTG